MKLKRSLGIIYKSGDLLLNLLTDLLTFRYAKSPTKYIALSSAILTPFPIIVRTKSVSI